MWQHERKVQQHIMLTDKWMRGAASRHTKAPNQPD